MTTPEQIRSVKESVSKMDLEDNSPLKVLNRKKTASSRDKAAKEEEKSRSPSPKLEDQSQSSCDEHTPRPLEPEVKVKVGTRVVVTRTWHPLLPVGRQGTVVRAHFEGKHDVEWDELEQPNNTGTVNVGDTNWEQVPEQVTPPMATSRLRNHTPLELPDVEKTDVSSATSSAGDSQVTSPLHSARWDTSEEESPEPASDMLTALIYDYDDTLLPSSWLHTKRLTIDDSDRVEPETRRVLDAHAKKVNKLLQLSIDFVGKGNVIIITNAERGWIDLSAAKFMPSTVKYLKQCHIMSARSSYEYISSKRLIGVDTYLPPMCWKPFAFHYQLQNYFQCPIKMRFRLHAGDLELSDFQRPNSPKQPRSSIKRAMSGKRVHQMLDDGTAASSSMFAGRSCRPEEHEQQMYWSTTAADPCCRQLLSHLTSFGRSKSDTSEKGRRTALQKQVISFGDSDSERQAVKEVCRNMSNVFCKSVKLQCKPSLDQLSKEVQVLIDQWENIICPAQNMDLMLQPEETQTEAKPKQ